MKKKAVVSLKVSAPDADIVEGKVFWSTQQQAVRDWAKNL